ncbi:MAG TPA: hypothetical protein VNZ55_00580 [Thermomicrobiales bacterium]|nr:hypothetical protein [Thermomicrobiales bacterium]
MAPVSFPTTTIFLVIITIVGLLTWNMSFDEHRRVIERFGFDYADLRSGYLWHVLSGLWVQSSPGLAFSMVLMVASSALILEFLAGSIRSAIIMIASDWISTILTAITLRILSGVGNTAATALLAYADSGSSAAAHGGWAAAAMLLPAPIGTLVWSLLFLVTVSQFWWQGLAPALAHLFGVLVGGICGFGLRRKASRSMHRLIDVEDGSELRDD